MNGAATLIVKIDYFIEPDARETGRILDRIGLAYSQMLKSEERQAQRLVVLSVEISSWIATLGALLEGVATAAKLIESREELSAFVHNLVVSLETMRQANAGQIPAAIRNLLVELATPINRKRASEVNIYVHGDNANVFILTGEEATEIARTFPRTGGSGGVQALPPLPSRRTELPPFARVQSAAEPGRYLDSNDPGDQALIQRAYWGTDDHPDSRKIDPNVPLPSPSREVGGNHREAELFAVNRQWFARSTIPTDPFFRVNSVPGNWDPGRRLQAKGYIVQSNQVWYFNVKEIEGYIT